MSVFIGNNAENVLSNCQGGYLMMAGRETGSQTLLLLAEAPYADTVFNTGINNTVTHAANGSEWYFSPNYSWGFAGLGQSVTKTQCDTNAGADRMCLHTVNNAGGYRIGTLTGLNESTAYEKLIFVADAARTPEPSTAALLGAGLAIAGGLRARSIRRKVI